jgi:hypothetical protein
VHSKHHEGAPHEPAGGKGQTKDPAEASENIRKARGEDDTAGPPDTDDDTKNPVRTDSRRTGNRPAFDRDR